MKNLATIQRISNIRPHPNADLLEIANVLGWQVIVKKGEFNIGDLCVYIVIDTVLPSRVEFEFLKDKHFRIKPVRLRGEISNGICFPLTILNENNKNKEIGTDVTEELNIIHYEKPVPVELAGEMKGYLPNFLIKTDEDNLRSYPDALEELKGKSYCITIKEDGSSGTFFIKDGEFGVCSRNVQLKPSDKNGFWKIEKKYGIEEIIKKEFPDKNIAFQGEVVGPGIQKNPMGLSEIEYHLFSIFDIDSQRFYSEDRVIYNNFISKVSLIEKGNNFNYTISELLNLAKLIKYPNKNPAEGIVIRPMDPFWSPILKKYWSGKILNEKYNM